MNNFSLLLIFLTAKLQTENTYSYLCSFITKSLRFQSDDVCLNNAIQYNPDNPRNWVARASLISRKKTKN